MGRKLIKKLNEGRVEAVVRNLRNFPTRKPELRDMLRIEADYFERNANACAIPDSASRAYSSALA